MSTAIDWPFELGEPVTFMEAGVERIGHVVHYDRTYGQVVIRTPEGVEYGRNQWRVKRAA